MYGFTESKYRPLPRRAGVLMGRQVLWGGVITAGFPGAEFSTDLWTSCKGVASVTLSHSVPLPGHSARLLSLIGADRIVTPNSVPCLPTRIRVTSRSCRMAAETSRPPLRQTQDPLGFLCPPQCQCRNQHAANLSKHW